MAVTPVITPQVAATPPTSTTPKTMSISPSTGELLVVIGYTGDGVSTVLATPTGVTGSTFTLQKSSGTTLQCGMYCWTAPVVTGGTYTLSVATTGGGNNWDLVCYRYPVGTTVGASNVGVAASGVLPSLALTTTGNNSGVAVVVGDWNGVAPGTPTFTTTAGTPWASPLSQTVSGSVTGFESYYSDVGAAGAKTIGMSLPTGQKPTTLAVELLPPPVGFVARGTGSATSVATGVATVATVPAGGFAVGTLVVADYVAWGWNGSATAAITDTRGNTWTQHLLSLTSGTGLLGHWSTMVTTAMLAGDTVTVTMSGSAGGIEDFALAIDNHTGVTNVGAQIGTNATATSTTPSATLTPTKTGLVYGHCHTDTTAPTITEDADATGGDTWHSLTKITTGTASHIVQLAGAYKYTTSAVAQTYNPTLSASQFWVAYVVSYPAVTATRARVVQLSQAVNRAATY